jgi:hypothetical protein
VGPYAPTWQFRMALRPNAPGPQRTPVPRLLSCRAPHAGIPSVRPVPGHAHSPRSDWRPFSGAEGSPAGAGTNTAATAGPGAPFRCRGGPYRSLGFCPLVEPSFCCTAPPQTARTCGSICTSPLQGRLQGPRLPLGAPGLQPTRRVGSSTGRLGASVDVSEERNSASQSACGVADRSAQLLIALAVR